jgi:hypothetical protein
MYILRYKNRTMKTGSIFDCLNELKRIFPPKATMPQVVAAGWSIDTVNV